MERNLEEKIGISGEDVDQNERNLMYCRVLGHPIQYAPRDQAVLDLGKMFLNHFIAAFRSVGRETTLNLVYWSGGIFDTKAEMMKVIMQKPSQRWNTPENRAFIRDNFRCMLSGYIDGFAQHRVLGLREEARACHHQLSCSGCSHIIPERIRSHASISSGKNVWDVLEQFGYITLSEELSGSKVHRLENLMTLDPNLQSSFEDWFFWLVPTEESNTYEINTLLPFTNLPEYVTFTSHNEEYPIPKRKYLELRAMCAAASYLSGVYGCIANKIWEITKEGTLESKSSSHHCPLPMAV